jgi:hypothetical protein
MAATMGSEVRMSAGAWVLSALALTCATILGACGGSYDGGMLRVDMSTERDAGSFLPASGDAVVVIALPGPHNAWSGDTLALVDNRGDWHYSVPLENLVRRANRPLMSQDTLSFFFAIAGSEGLRPENTDVRLITWGSLLESRSVFRFGDAFDHRMRATVRFAVDMNNQSVLGFFRPEAGDRVTVSGNFTEWSPEGLPLEDLGGGIFGASLPVSFDPGRPLEYRFRILPSGRRAVLVNEGWETLPPRRLSVSGTSAHAPVAAFSDLRRVVRLTVSTAGLENQGLFDADRDILQARFLLDDEKVLSDALFELRRGLYETAIAIPLTVSDVSWQLVTDIGRRALSELEPLEVGPQGLALSWPK